MIIGVGIDVVDVARFTDRCERTPGLAEHLLTEGERGLRPESLAGRFAAKEALAKALGAPGMRWHDAVVVRMDNGQPVLEISGTVQARADELGVAHLHLSISHDAGIATAIVIAEG